MRSVPGVPNPQSAETVEATGHFRAFIGMLCARGGGSILLPASEIQRFFLRYSGCQLAVENLPDGLLIKLVDPNTGETVRTS